MTVRDIRRSSLRALRAQCAQTPVISITGAFGVKPRRARPRVELSADRRRRRLADRAAMLADQEHHEIAAGVIVARRR